MDLIQSTGNHSQGVQQCALVLSKHVLQNLAKDSNCVFCPLSIQLLLSLIAAGSKGSTLQQLNSFLKSSSTESLLSLASEIRHLLGRSILESPSLHMATGVWIDKSFSLRTYFEHVVNNVYQASSAHVDFQREPCEVTEEINSWIRKKTSGFIEDLLPPGSVNEMTRLVFANALYFKGTWKENFDNSATRDDEFHLLNGSSIRTPFMTSTKKQFISCFDGFKVLKLPYNGGSCESQFSMYIFLPDAMDGLPILLETVLKDSEEWHHYFPKKQVEVGTFKLPLFKLSFGFEASEILRELGLVSPFSDEADLSGIVESSKKESLSVSAIFTKGFIEVDEEGTKAAAASAAVISVRSVRLSSKMEFVADHSFLFMVREDVKGLMMFIGQVLQP